MALTTDQLKDKLVIAKDMLYQLLEERDWIIVKLSEADNVSQAMGYLEDAFDYASRALFAVNNGK